MPFAFGTIVVVSMLAVLLEIVNPHSFLDVFGACLRGFLLIIGAGLWYFLAKKFPSKFGRAGFFVLLFTGGLYMMTALYLLYQNSLFESQKGQDTTIQKDNSLLPSDSDTDPTHYQDITVNIRPTTVVTATYVKAGGTVSILSERIENISVIYQQDFPPLKSIFHTTTKPKDSKNTMTFGDYGDYDLSFAAPTVPGSYWITILRDDRPEPEKRKTLLLIVLDAVSTESAALTIAEHFIRSQIPPHLNVRDWREKSRMVINENEWWRVSMEFEYQSCGVDFEENICTPQLTQTDLLIRKKNGVVTTEL